jgi:hypothetical protein
MVGVIDAPVANDNEDKVPVDDHPNGDVDRLASLQASVIHCQWDKPMEK